MLRFVPELVLSGDLCPHQDYVYFSVPSEREQRVLSEFRTAVDSFTQRLRSAKPEEISPRVQKLLTALKRLLREATDVNLKSLYDAVLEESILPIADAFQSEVSKNVPSHEAKIAQIGRYFAAGADRREATKFGILLLEVSGNRTDSSLLETHSTTNSPCSQHSRWPMSPMILLKHCGALRDRGTAAEVQRFRHRMKNYSP
jgi:hypothetical protein